MVGAVGLADEVDDVAGLSPGGLDTSLLCCAHQVRELGKDLLDRVQARAVGWPEHQVGAGLADGMAGALSRVAAEVVEDDDVAWCQRQHQHLLDMGGERVALDRSVDHAGGIDVVGP